MSPTRLCLLMTACLTLGPGLHVRGEPVPATGPKTPERVIVKPSPLDQLDPTQIAAEERLARQPSELVAVLGTQRGWHPKGVTCLAFRADGRMLASGGNDHLVRLWDPATLRPLGVLRGHKDGVLSIAFSPRRKLLASASADRTVRLWDLRGKKAKDLATLAEHKEKLVAVTFTQDGKTLASADRGGTVRLWDVGEARPRQRVRFQAHKSPLTGIALSPNGKWLASAGEDGIVRLWNLGTYILGEKAGIEDNTKGYWPAFSPDGKTLATVGGNHTIELWDVSGRQLRLRTVLKGHLERVNAVAFAPDGKKLVSASRDRTVRLWDLSAKKPRQRCFLRTTFTEVQAVSFSPDGKTVATAGWEQPVRLWDLTGAKPRERPLLPGHRGPVLSLAFAPDGKTLASGGEDWTVRLWHLEGKKFVPGATGRAQDDRVNSVTFSLDGKTLVSREEFSVRLWHVAGRKLKEGESLPGEIYSFEPDGKTLTTGSYLWPNDINIWDLSTGRPKKRLGIPVAKLFGWELLPGGKTMVIGYSGWNRNIRQWVEVIELWDVSGAEPEKKSTLSPTPKGVEPWVYAPSGRSWLLDESDMIIRIWDKRKARPRLHATLRGHTGYVTSVQFEEPGKTLVSAALDRKLIFWDISGKKLRELQFPSVIHQIAIAPDGRHVATANGNGTIYVLRFSRESQGK
jgi:WD40 repeat protein